MASQQQVYAKLIRKGMKPKAARAFARQAVKRSAAPKRKGK